MTNDDDRLRSQPAVAPLLAELLDGIKALRKRDEGDQQGPADAPGLTTDPTVEGPAPSA